MQDTTKKLEWNIDMDSLSCELEFADRGTARLPGRCKSCWGPLMGRSDEARAVTGIKCRVCGTTIQGEKAQDEEKRITNEATINLLNIRWGHCPEYGDGLFLRKVFPALERQEEDEIRRRISKRVAEGSKRDRLTRNSFPAGSPGFLYFQAKVLIAGVGDIYNLHDRFAMERDEYSFREDGSVSVVDRSWEAMLQSAKGVEHMAMKQMGCFMSSAMLAAFACELAIKAICLTCKDEALKDHDLLDLYRDLPEPCRRRIEADYENIEEVVKEGRQTFGKWRYFECNIGEQGMRGMIDWERTFKMAKAARVILDEAEMVGLAGASTRKLNENVKARPGEKAFEQKIKLTIVGREAPLKEL